MSIFRPSHRYTASNEDLCPRKPKNYSFLILNLTYSPSSSFPFSFVLFAMQRKGNRAGKKKILRRTHVFFAREEKSKSRMPRVPPYRRTPPSPTHVCARMRTPPKFSIFCFHAPLVSHKQLITNQKTSKRKLHPPSTCSTLPPQAPPGKRSIEKLNSGSNVEVD